MKITICGSIAFIDHMTKVKQQLETLGHEVQMPPTQIQDEQGHMIPVIEYYKIRKSANDDEKWVWDRKAEAISKHLDKVDWADAILVLNYTKHNIENYIGANTLIEMGLAFWQKKPVFLLNPIPNVSYKEEILGMQPTLINQDLQLIK